MFVRTQASLTPPGVHINPPGNSRLPQYAQENTVNIYLFHGDSGQQVFSRLDYPNPNDRAGDITALVNDSWWGDRGQDWRGQDISYLFYWVITPGGQSLGANYLPQATFTAIRESLLLMTNLPSAYPYFYPSPGSFPETNGDMPLQRRLMPIQYFPLCPQLPHLDQPDRQTLYRHQDLLAAYRTAVAVHPSLIGRLLSSQSWAFWLFWSPVSSSSCFSGCGDENMPPIVTL